MITVDIGNTSINFIWFNNNRPVRAKSLLTKTASKEEIRTVIPRKTNEQIFVCSVVPKATKIFKSLYTNLYIAGENIKVPIKCLYDRNDIGMDRLVGALATKNLFPRSRFILDFGTAITLDFLSHKGEYQGGIILPGIGSTLKVLSECALLPSKITVKKNNCIIPKNTKESINCGLVKGFSAMVNSLVSEYKAKLKISNLNNTVITGGEAGVVISQLNFKYKYEPLLVAKGLQLLSKKIITKS